MFHPGIFSLTDICWTFVGQAMIGYLPMDFVRHDLGRETDMRNRRQMTSIFLSVVLLLSMCMPLSGSVVNAGKTSVGLDRKTLTLTAGKSATLRLKGAKKKATWTSSKKSVASVKAKSGGKTATVKAKKAGRTTITAKYRKKVYRCRVTVQKKEAAVTPTPEATTGSAVTPEPTGGTYTQITQQEARKMMMIDDGHVIVDVRREDEYSEGHIPGAILIPNETIGTEMPEQLPDLNQIILIYCRSGNRSKQASQKLADIGYTNVYEFGGIKTWPYGIER